MKIAVRYEPDQFTCGFYLGQMWVRDNSRGWFQAESSFCHHNIIGGECTYCALIVEDDADE